MRKNEQYIINYLCEEVKNNLKTKAKTNVFSHFKNKLILSNLVKMA